MMRTYGFDPVKLSSAYTMEQLVALMAEVDADPLNQNPPGSSIYLKNARGRKRSDAVAWAIYHKQCKTKPPIADGYSGRNSNRRR